MSRITAGHLETSSSRCFRGLIQTPPAADEDVRIRSFAYFAFVMRRAAPRRAEGIAPDDFPRPSRSALTRPLRTRRLLVRSTPARSELFTGARDVIASTLRLLGHRHKLRPVIKQKHSGLVLFAAQPVFGIFLKLLSKVVKLITLTRGS